MTSISTYPLSRCIDRLYLHMIRTGAQGECMKCISGAHLHKLPTCTLRLYACLANIS